MALLTTAKSGVVHQVVRREGHDEVVAEARVTFAVVSFQTGRALELDDALLGKMGLDRPA